VKSQIRPRNAAAPLLCGIVLGLGAVVLAYGAVCRSEAAERAAFAAGTPEEALAAFVRLDGSTFAGACEQTRAPDDIGSRCATLVGERDGLSAYLLGRTFSEFDTWVFLRGALQGWTVLGTAPLDFLDTSGAIPWPR
jgi:hypothetical protein